MRVVEPSMSVKKMVTRPDGAAPAAASSPSPRNSSMAFSTASVSPRYGAPDSPSRSARRASGIWEARPLARFTSMNSSLRRCSTSVGVFTCGSWEVTSYWVLARTNACMDSCVAASRQNAANRRARWPSDHPRKECATASVYTSQSLSLSDASA